MHREVINGSSELPLRQFSGPFSSASSVDYNRFGGVRHGFNTSSNRTHPYPHISNLTPQPYCLPPIRSVPTDPNLRNWSQHMPRDESSPSAPSISSTWTLAPSFINEDDTCFSCHRDTETTLPTQISSPDIELAQQAYNVASQHVRVAVDDLLNSAHPNENRRPNEAPIPGFNSTNANEPGRARTISSTSSMSICSSSTLRSTPNIVADRGPLMDGLYYTCRDAAETYISTLRPLRRHASCSSSRGRHHPYAPGPRPGPQARDSRPPAPSLMDNISAICTHLWRRARSNVLSPRREEAVTVRVMRDLYAWGEIICRGFQHDFLDENPDWGGAAGSVSSCAAVDGWERVGEAASELCEWLGDDEAVVACEEVLQQLRGLKEREEGRGSPGGFAGVL